MHLDSDSSSGEEADEKFLDKLNLKLDKTHKNSNKISDDNDSELDSHKKEIHNHMPAESPVRTNFLCADRKKRQRWISEEDSSSCDKSSLFLKHSKLNSEDDHLIDEHKSSVDGTAKKLRSLKATKLKNVDSSDTEDKSSGYKSICKKNLNTETSDSDDDKPLKALKKVNESCITKGKKTKIESRSNTEDEEVLKPKLSGSNDSNYSKDSDSENDSEPLSKIKNSYRMLASKNQRKKCIPPKIAKLNTDSSSEDDKHLLTIKKKRRSQSRRENSLQNAMDNCQPFKKDGRKQRINSSDAENSASEDEIASSLDSQNKQSARNSKTFIGLKMDQAVNDVKHCKKEYDEKSANSPQQDELQSASSNEPESDAQEMDLGKSSGMDEEDVSTYRTVSLQSEEDTYNEKDSEINLKLSKRFGKSLKSNGNIVERTMKESSVELRSESESSDQNTKVMRKTKKVKGKVSPVEASSEQEQSETILSSDSSVESETEVKIENRRKSSKTKKEVLSDSEDDKPLKSNESNSNVKKKFTKPKPDEDRHIIRMKRYISTAGLRVQYAKVLSNCKSRKAKIECLLEILKEAGLKGKPTLESCKKLRKKRETQKEVNELDLSNIIENGGWGRRETRSLVPPKMGDAFENLRPTKKIFSRLKGIVDSEDSDD